MATIRVGVREFQEQMSQYLESESPVAVMRHGETLGIYAPMPKRAAGAADIAELRAAADRLAKEL